MKKDIERFRRFNRFYTDFLGLLDRNYLNAGVSLAQARVLYEIGEIPGETSAALASRLHMDRGQLSRLLNKLEKREWVRRIPRVEDRRSAELMLTDSGWSVLSNLVAMSNAQAKEILDALPSETARRRLGKAMVLIESLLGKAGRTTLREGRSGDLGWILTRHAEFYGQEYGFDESFEGYVVDGMAAYALKESDRRGIFMAEVEGLPVGSIAIVKGEDGWGQLRWFYVDPWARGKGVGRMLMEQAIEYARGCNLKRILLWTFVALQPARNLYISLGFNLAESKQGSLGGINVMEERWEKILS